MYATAADWVTAYGMGELFMLARDEDCQLTHYLLQQAVAGVFDEQSSTREQAAATNALARINAALDYATRRINSYIGLRVSLPLLDAQVVQTPLKECALALSRCHLMDDTDNATERADECCGSWLKWLEQVSKGVVSLGATAATSSMGSNHVSSGAVAYTGMLRGYSDMLGGCDE